MLSRTVGAVITNIDGKLLMQPAGGKAEKGLWSIPWGVVGKGESPKEALLRKMLDEFGIVPREVAFLGMLQNEYGEQHIFSARSGRIKAAGIGLFSMRELPGIRLSPESRRIIELFAKSIRPKD